MRAVPWRERSSAGDVRRRGVGTLGGKRFACRAWLVASLVMACCLTAGFLFAAAALADTPFGERGSEAGQMSAPTGVAVDDAYGRVYVADKEDRRVSVFDLTGRFLFAFGWGVGGGSGAVEVCTTTCVVGEQGTNAGEFGSNGPLSIAVNNDPSSPSFHDVYVYDGSNRRVEKFEVSSPNQPAAARYLASFGQKGSGAGEFLESTDPIAVDAAGGVWVADRERVERFSEDGVFSSQLVLIGQRTELLALEPSAEGVEAPGFYTGYPFNGTLSSDEVNGDEVTVRERVQPGEIAKYSAAGVRENVIVDEFGPSPHHKAVATNAAGDLFVNDEVYDDASSEFVCTYKVGESGCPFSPLGKTGIVEFNAAGGEVRQWDVHASSEANLIATGLAFSETADALLAVGGGNLVTTGFLGRVMPLPAAGPLVSEGSESASEVGASAVVLKGVVDPEGHASSYRFVYVPAAEYEKSGFTGAGVKRTGVQSLVAGFEESEVTARVAGLSPDTAYRFEVEAENSCGSECGVVSGEAASFATGPVAAFEFEPVAEPAETTATVGMFVNPEGLATSVHLEYGTGSVSEHSTAAQSVGEGLEYQFVKAGLAGLVAGASYRYEMIAENAAGTIASGEGSFTAAGGGCENAALRTGFSAGLGECRAYEQVTPVDKGGIGPAAGIAVQPNGEGVAYYSWLPFPGSPGGTVSSYVARRTASGWQNTPISPPTENRSTEGLTDAPYVRDISPDLSTAIFQTSYPIDKEAQGRIEEPPGYEQPVQVYEREANGTFNWLSQPPTLPDTYPDQSVLVGASSDNNLSHAFIATEKPLTPQAKGSKAINLYENTNGHIQSINLAPGTETLIPGGADVGYELQPVVHGVDEPWTGAPSYQSAVSANGESVFFTAPLSGGAPQLYVREHGETVEVSVSQRSGSAGQPAEAGARFMAASRYGSKALFFSESQLTDAAPKGGGFYEYATEGGGLTFVAADPAGVSSEEIVGSTSDLSYVYFWGKSEATVTPTLFVLHDRLVREVGKVELGNYESAAHDQASMSADGRFVVFVSGRQLTAYRNEGHPEVYEYDANETQGLRCVSCRPDDGAASGEASLMAQQHTGFFGVKAPVQLHDVTSGGAVFFNSTEKLVARDDNSAEDVYEYNDGVVRLISGGVGSAPSVLLGISEDGSNVFFFTYESLAGQDTDNGIADIYDARVGGGIAARQAAVPCASNETCHVQESTLNLAVLTPVSALFEGEGNLTPTPMAMKPATKHKIAKKKKKKAKKKKAKHKAKKKSNAKKAAKARHRHKAASVGGSK